MSGSVFVFLAHPPIRNDPNYPIATNLNEL